MAQEVAGRKAEPSLILANHAAWGPGQMEDEIGSGDWHTLPAAARDVFCHADLDLWKATVERSNAKKLGVMLRLGGMPTDPGLNRTAFRARGGPACQDAWHPAPFVGGTWARRMSWTSILGSSSLGSATA